MRVALSAISLVLVLTNLGGAVDVLADDPNVPIIGKRAPEAEGAKPAADEAPEPFAKVRDEWQAVEKQLDEIIAQFRKAPATEREALRKKYLALLDDAKAIVPRLRKAALAAYQGAPNKDPEIVRVLVGILANDVRSDENSAALKLAKILMDNKAPEDAIWGLAGVAAFSSDQFDDAEKYFKLAAEAKGGLESPADSYNAQIDEFKAAWKKEQQIREAEAKADDLPRVKFTTTKGVIVIELFENEAPKAVGNFVNLIEKKYYDGLTFHRVLANFMAQGGCPKGDGTGGPGYNIPCEVDQENYRHHFSGTLSMAHAGPNTGGSQFFLTFRPTSHLDGKHTAFGRVIEGMDVLATLQRRDPQRNPVEPDKIIKAEVLRKRAHEYEPTKTK